MIAGVLLAAGRSERMGQPKLLLPWQGVPLIRHMAQIALASELDELIVVTGHRAQHMAAALAELPLRLVHNAQFLDGQSTSLRAGIAALAPEVEAAVVLLADHPLLQPATIDALLACYRRADAPLAVPRYEGRRGNPVLFGRALFGELLEITGDQGARAVVKAHAAQIAWVDVADEGILLDLDTPDMYAQLADRVPQEGR